MHQGQHQLCSEESFGFGVSPASPDQNRPVGRGAHSSRWTEFAAGYEFQNLVALDRSVFASSQLAISNLLA